MSDKSMNIYKKLQRARAMLQEKELKKSGWNDHKKYHYFELGDFMPSVNKIFDELGLFSQFNTTHEEATLIIFDVDNPESTLTFSSPTAEANVPGGTSIQHLGALHTYMRRYLYFNALELSENDLVDSAEPAPKQSKPKQSKPVEKKEVEVPLVDEKTLSEILDLINSLEDEELEANICKGYRIERLEELNKKQSETVKNTLIKRLEAKGEEQ